MRREVFTPDVIERDVELFGPVLTPAMAEQPDATNDALNSWR